MCLISSSTSQIHRNKWWRQWVTIEMLRELTQKSKRAERPRPSHWEDRPSSKNAKNRKLLNKIKVDISESSADESESDIQKVRGHVKWPLVSPPCLNCWELIRTSISSQVVAGSYNEDTSQIHKNRITEINVKLPKGTRNPRHTATENIRPTLVTACDKKKATHHPAQLGLHTE